MLRTSLKAVALLAAIMFGAGCSRSSGAAPPSPTIPVPAVTAEGDLASRFGKYYEPVPVDVKPAVPDYTLPLAPDGIQNLADVLSKLTPLGGAEAPDQLLKNGFVTIPYGAEEDVVAAYQDLKQKGVPVFVTSDSVLHLYHIQFDETLREIEEKEFYPDLVALTKTFQDEMKKRYDSASGPEREAFKKGLAYFTVGRKLLEPQSPVPPEVADWVEWELKKIDEHAGFSDFMEARTKAIFAYSEDYSQYVPRGHYTRSEELKRYFKAMMWYGRMTMLIKGHEKNGPESADPALVSVDEARAQTTLGAAISALLPALKIGDRSAFEVWQRMYAVTAYYVGLADDLTPSDYQKALASACGEKFSPRDFNDPAKLLKFKTELAKLAPPAIYSGTGQSAVNLDREGGALSPEQLDKILAKTTGFRLMGQRYIPDSYILGQLVAPVIELGARGDVFTAYTVPELGVIRAFPRGLDVMAVLGSDRAREVLGQLGDADYKGYDARLTGLREQFSNISTADWNRNLYWSWLYALKGLIQPASGPGWPTFMSTDAWKDKQLNAVLGSWSSLRHDTILYAKQSYTPTITITSADPRPRPEPPKPVVGYVEPVPEFYARLVALTKMSAKGLQDLKALDPDGEARLNSLAELLARLQAISEKELRNDTLTEDDYVFIRDFGANLSAIVAGASEAGQKTTLIADVHTDQNSSQVLEEGTGYVRLMLVAYKLPQGHILVGAGPVFSYYEFKHPMSDRLTDEKWRTMLPSNPPLPDWTKSFARF
jgi:hypothetical protein